MRGVKINHCSCAKLLAVGMHEHVRKHHNSKLSLTNHLVCIPCPFQLIAVFIETKFCNRVWPDSIHWDYRQACETNFTTSGGNTSRMKMTAHSLSYKVQKIPPTKEFLLQHTGRPVSLSQLVMLELCAPPITATNLSWENIIGSSQYSARYRWLTVSTYKATYIAS